MSNFIIFIILIAIIYNLYIYHQSNQGYTYPLNLCLTNEDKIHNEALVPYPPKINRSNKATLFISNINFKSNININYLVKDFNDFVFYRPSPQGNSFNVDIKIDNSKVHKVPKYTIDINKGINISANSLVGGIYAIQTLKQLIRWNNNQDSYEIKNTPIKIINDQPRYRYRSVLIDSSRHLF